MLYIFGDNVQREGNGGQAASMRGEPNAFGIVTKRRPDHGIASCYFYDNQPDVFEKVEKDFDRLKEIKHHYRGIIIPADGIGTGLARLPEFAPNLLRLIEEKLEKL